MLKALYTAGKPTQVILSPSETFCLDCIGVHRLRLTDISHLLGATNYSFIILVNVLSLLTLHNNQHSFVCL